MAAQQSERVAGINSNGHQWTGGREYFAELQDLLGRLLLRLAVVAVVAVIYVNVWLANRPRGQK